MNVEIVEFYPIEENKITDFLSGTLKIRLPDQEMVIMGIFVSRSKGRYFFQLPGRTGIHHETGEKVRYPAIVFEDHEKQKVLIQAIIEKGKAFIEARLADTERPLKFPPAKTMQQPAPKPSKSQAQSDCAIVTKKRKEDPLKTAKPQAIEQIAEPIKKLASLEFKDPPKRSALARSTSKFARK